MEDLVVMNTVNLMSKFWRGKRVLLTGHTGFKGAWLALWLHQLGAKVTGVSLPPATTPNLFNLTQIESITDSHFCDIRDVAALAALIEKANPEIVFHLAAQALVRASYREPLATFATNTQGTANVLDALRTLVSLRVIVAITTDKVYKNFEQLSPFREDDPLGGHDPYSASKAASEIVVASYRDAFFAPKSVAVASARAGNVIGGGDWSDDRLIPDAMRAWQSGQPLVIRRPEAIRPWQHVLEPLAGYLVLAQRLWEQPELAGAYNFGPPTNQVATVRQVVELARTAYGNGEVLYGDGAEGPHEAGVLVLGTDKARVSLGVTPKWVLTETVNRAISWYQAQSAGGSAISLCEAEITAYEMLA